MSSSGISPEFLILPLEISFGVSPGNRLGILGILLEVLLRIHPEISLGINSGIAIGFASSLHSPWDSSRDLY